MKMCIQFCEKHLKFVVLDSLTVTFRNPNTVQIITVWFWHDYVYFIGEKTEVLKSGDEF
jgi:hypothetical protein